MNPGTNPGINPETVREFFAAIRTGDAAAVRAMAAADASLVRARDENGVSAFAASKYSRQEETARVLLESGAELDIFDAILAGDETRLARLLAGDRKLGGAYSQDGWTPLHLAAFFGHEGIAMALLEHGADVHARSRNAMENTPLHAAAAGPKGAAIAALLIGRGADVNARQHGGWTALHAAAQSGNVELTQLLIARGADGNARAANNQSALDLAMTKGRQEIADILDTPRAGAQGAP